MSTNSAYAVEYSKSDRSTCIVCKSSIKKNTIRFAVIVRSPKFDGKILRWYHRRCFCKKIKCCDVEKVTGFDSLRWSDQESLRRHLKGSSTKDVLAVQYAKSNSKSCHACESPLEADALCLSKNELNDQPEKWYHINCFDDIKDDVDSNHPDAAYDRFEGFTELNDEAQEEFKQKLDASIMASRKRRAATDGDGEVTTVKWQKIENETPIKKEQNELLWSCKDALRRQVPQDVLKQLLEHNSQKLVSGEHNLIEAVADCLVFGALEQCPTCHGCIVFNYTMYQCTGHLTEWTKCSFSTTLPDRRPFQIPDDVKDSYTILSKDYAYTKRDRSLTTPTSTTINTIRAVKEPKYNSKLPLKAYSIVIAGRLPKTATTLQVEVQRLGGKVLPVVDETIDVVISTPDEIRKNTKKIQDARSFNIHVVPVEFLEEVRRNRPWTVMENLKISSWGIVPHIRKPKPSTTAKKSLPDKSRMILKDGAAIDSGSGLEDFCHVMKHSGDDGIYAVVLGAVNIANDKNSYYKIQLLEADAGNRWGRTGTTRGGKKTEQYDDRAGATKAFEALFFDKTGNHWSSRGAFKKVPSKLYPLDIDFGYADIQAVFDDVKTKKRSNLPPSVQDLICFIFNVQSMEEAMLSFDIDLTKMPLGRLSRNQLNQGYQILTELQTLIDDGNTNSSSVTDASNRFYTLIPHSFDRGKPSVLDRIELIQSKREMIDNLLEIEKAYSMLRETHAKQDEQSIDDYYQKLKCLLQPVDRNSEEFQRIEPYINNTDAPQQRKYTIILKELFTVAREGESDRFQKWKSTDNRQLLWHGSRRTNFAGILSEGLRVAPPEAPTTGYNFGKGVYFADMVCKGAYYCFPKPEAVEGLMLLCEVALGKMEECLQRTTFSADTLPAGAQSVKGSGKIAPNPNHQYIADDGMIIPMGRHMNARFKKTQLAYNEFVVYNVDQINMRYLLRVDFQFHK